MGSDKSDQSDVNGILDHPDFIIFDLDPYLYSGKEAAGAEPELNRAAFTKGCEVALWLKEVLDGLSLTGFVKTSGKTGLHVYVPIVRNLDYRQSRRAAETVGKFLMQKHADDITMEWAPERRTGKVFMDYAQNVRGKTLACAYSPRPYPEATVSTPLRWEELGKVYPTDFTIITVPDRLKQTGDLWADILKAKKDLGVTKEIRE
jgi:bifunctional non-homologous end joining protein LigD